MSKKIYENKETVSLIDFLKYFFGKDEEENSFDDFNDIDLPPEVKEELEKASINAERLAEGINEEVKENENGINEIKRKVRKGQVSKEPPVNGREGRERE